MLSYTQVKVQRGNTSRLTPEAVEERQLVKAVIAEPLMMSSVSGITILVTNEFEVLS